MYQCEMTGVLVCDFCIYCSSVENDGISALLNHDMVDVWSIKSDHADIRLTNKLYQEMKDEFPECYVLYSNVEALAHFLQINSYIVRHTAHVGRHCQLVQRAGY